MSTIHELDKRFEQFSGKADQMLKRISEQRNRNSFQIPKSTSEQSMKSVEASTGTNHSQYPSEDNQTRIRSGRFGHTRVQGHFGNDDGPRNARSQVAERIARKLAAQPMEPNYYAILEQKKRSQASSFADTNNNDAVSISPLPTSSESLLSQQILSEYSSQSYYTAVEKRKEATNTSYPPKPRNRNINPIRSREEAPVAPDASYKDASEQQVKKITVINGKVYESYWEESGVENMRETEAVEAVAYGRSSMWPSYTTEEPAYEASAVGSFGAAPVLEKDYFSKYKGVAKGLKKKAVKKPVPKVSREHAESQPKLRQKPRYLQVPRNYLLEEEQKLEEMQRENTRLKLAKKLEARTTNKDNEKGWRLTGVGEKSVYQSSFAPAAGSAGGGGGVEGAEAGGRPQSGGVNRGKMDLDKDRKLREMIARPEYDGEGSMDFYKVGPLLGQGQFSKVFTGWHRLTNRKVAIKQYNMVKLERDPTMLAQVKREVAMLKKLSHEGVVHLYESFQSRQCLSLVLEHVGGGSLAALLRRQRSMSSSVHSAPVLLEGVARTLFAPLARGVAHMHARHVMHRDIKLENVMLQPAPQAALLPKLVDMGFGAFCRVQHGKAGGLCEAGEGGKPLTQLFGSPIYMAPEVWEKSYGKAADIWSLGVLLYVLLAGQFPFHAASQEDLQWVVKKGNFWLPPELSPDVKDLLQLMIDPDDRTRYTAQQVILHPWVSGAPGDHTDGTIFSTSDIDRDLLGKMSEMGFNTNLVTSSLDDDARNQCSSTYKLLKEEALCCKESV